MFTHNDMEMSLKANQHTIADRPSLIETCIRNWYLTLERVLDHKITSTNSSFDWDPELLGALAELSEIASMASDLGGHKCDKVGKLLTGICKARSTYYFGIGDDNEAARQRILRVEDVESVIREMGGSIKKTGGDLKPLARAASMSVLRTYTIRDARTDLEGADGIKKASRKEGRKEGRR
ncbi:hypothetical protein HBI79_182560 [Parastagonospora nodorum]|nr:hypothetical protein HBI79_182560 [Parastagonospora nodorum]KAH5308664.1 hypothetical protein HBI12_156830 [Parastagonospora nodorum]